MITALNEQNMNPVRYLKDSAAMMKTIKEEVEHIKEFMNKKYPGSLAWSKARGE